MKFFFKDNNLENKGEIVKENTTKQNYKPTSSKNYKAINNSVVQFKRSSSIVAAHYSKDNFLSSYEKTFMKNNLA